MSGQAGLFDDAPASAARPYSLLLASAGTGKTYRLAGHFAALLLAGVEPDRVLATTFTRKAAGEILDRVLQRVREAAEPGAASARKALDGEIERIAPGSPRLTAPHCEAVLARLVRRVDRFRVRTIDAFFVRLAGLFASELALAPDWRITDDVEERAITREIVARVLDELEFEERLELLRGMTRGAATRGAETALVTAIEKAEMIGRDADDAAWSAVEALDGPDESAVDAALSVVLAAEPALNKNEKPNKNWEKALAALSELAKAQQESGSPRGVSKGFLEVTMLQRALTREPFDRHSIPPALEEALRTLAASAFSGMTETLVARNLATAAFLRHYLHGDAALRRELGAYRFQDFSRALLDGPLRLERDEWLMELGYRLDGNLDHLLLDEFQDTAATQWRLLEPLAEEVLAGGHGRSFFCVGDVKQSIYGWRGGEPRLLAGMDVRYPSLDRDTMAVSWRSSSVVLDAVNAVFDGIVARPCLQADGKEAALAATEAWAEGFEEHSAARTELRGAVRLWQTRKADKDAGEKDLDPALRLAVERVAALHDEQPKARIAVLVRAKGNIARLRFLLSQRGIEASDEGGNPLTDSLGVTWILALLQLADHPGDGVARLQVARSPFAADYGLDRDTVETPAGALAAGTASRRVRDELLRRGYGAFTARCVETLASTSTAWDARRLEQLVDLALAYDERASLRPIDFVDAVRERRVPDPTASRVKVMTIHASKGLEFDAVVLPELGKQIQLTLDDYVAGRDDIIDPPTLATARPNKLLAEHHGQLGELQAAEQRRSMTDALSALYVAMTRAVHGLELIVPAPSSSSKALRFSALVAPGFGGVEGTSREPEEDGASEESRAELVWEHPESTSDWFDDDADAHEVAVVPEAALRLEPGAEESAPSALRPSGSTEHRPTSVEALLAPRESEAQLRGVGVHALFEDVIWIEDESRGEDDLLAACSLRIAAPLACDEAVRVFLRAVQSPDAQALLARPDGNAVVFHERSFDVEVSDLDVDPFRVRGVIDRLVLHRLDGGIVRADIVDYKTDALGEPAALLEEHGAQLRMYRSAMAAMFGLEESAVTATILWVGANDDARAVAVP